MIAYVTSIGETTEELCVWSLKRNGFFVVLLRDPDTSLAAKLKQTYNYADDDFVRVDADVVVNKNLTPEIGELANAGQWWMQFWTYEWYKQDFTHGGVQFIKKQALPALRANVDRMQGMERPESELYRLPEFHDPRRCDWYPMVVGLHGFKQADYQRIKDTKTRRGQIAAYDFELAEKLDQL